MVIVKIKKWGNSMGIVIPKDEVRRLKLKVDQDVNMELFKKENPLKELHGFGKRMGGKKITKKEFLEYRRSFESKWM